MNDSVSPEKFLGRKGTRNIDLRIQNPTKRGLQCHIYLIPHTEINNNVVLNAVPGREYVSKIYH
jgi:hypothetical protein